MTSLPTSGVKVDPEALKSANSLCEGCDKKAAADRKHGILSKEEMNQYKLLDELNQLYNSMKPPKKAVPAPAGEATGPDFTHTVPLEGQGSLLNKAYVTVKIDNDTVHDEMPTSLNIHPINLRHRPHPAGVFPPPVLNLTPLPPSAKPVTGGCPFTDPSTNVVMVNRDQLPQALNAKCCYNGLQKDGATAFIQISQGIVHNGSLNEEYMLDEESPPQQNNLNGGHVVSSVQFNEVEPKQTPTTVDGQALRMISMQFVGKLNELRHEKERE